MSNKAVGFAIESRIGDPTRKIILLVMADSANSETGVTWHSAASIATRAECSTRTVQRHLRELLELDYIREASQSFVAHIRADRRPTVYQVATSELDRVQWDADRHGVTERHPVRGDTAPPDGVTDSAPRGDTAMSPKSEGNRKGNRNSLVAVGDGAASEPDPFDAFWNAYPRKVGKPAARKAYKAAAKRLRSNSSGIDVDALIAEAGAALAADPNLPPETFIPHASTWLGRDGWDDGPLPSRTGREELHKAATGYSRDDESSGMSGADWRAAQ